MSSRRGGRRGRGRRDNEREGQRVSQTDQFTIDANWDEKVEVFEEMDLKPELLSSVLSHGFTKPSEIQALSIKPIIMGRNVIAQSPLRSGKTLAFIIGILNRIQTEEKATQALILAPTGLIAAQIYNLINNIGSQMKNLTVHLFRGGNDMEEDQRNASYDPHIFVSTPGRALDLIRRHCLNCENIRIACIDEADELLSTDFFRQMQAILGFINKKAQFLLFAPKYTKENIDNIDQFITDPIKIVIQNENPLEGIKHFYVKVGDISNKFPTLIDIYSSLDIQKAIIFANTTKTVENLKMQICHVDFMVSAIHSKLDPIDIDKTIEEFRIGKIHSLVSTDLIARGIYFEQPTIVFNFELPNVKENYLYRSIISRKDDGKGIVINICDGKDMAKIRQIERMYNIQIHEIPTDISDIMKFE